MRASRPTALAVLLVLPACGLLGGVDPRCESLCAVQEPSLAGAHDICSQASADRCKADCNARISGVTSLCATCLLEKAEFRVPPTSSSGDSCVSGTCTTTGRAGSCDYPEGDTSAREACIRQVSPRREIECTAAYRPVDECASTCTTR